MRYTRPVTAASRVFERWVVGLLLAGTLVGGGCGGSGDAGGGGVDAGAGADAGGAGADAGGAGVDAGGAGTDAGGAGTDAGGGGMDAGGGGMDASAGMDAGAGVSDAGALADAPAPYDAGRDAGCKIGEATSTATSTMLDLFGTPEYFNGGAPLPAGRYRITYLDGCMKYSAPQGWTVNAYASGMSCWYVIGATTADRIVVPPGTVGYIAGSGAYTNFDDCVTASLAVPPVEFAITTAQPLGIWLLDSPYSDNLAGVDGRNPRWGLESIDCETADM